MMTVFEVFSALFGLFLLGNVHSAWQTNPILSHPLGRFAIAFVIISAILGWNYYQSVQEDINKEKEKIAEDKKIEHEDWTFAKQINTRESYCVFLKKYPKGRFSEQAEPLCHSQKNKQQAALAKQQVEAALQKALAKRAAQIAAQDALAEQKSEELRLLEKKTAKLKAEAEQAILVQQQAELAKQTALDKKAETERQNALQHQEENAREMVKQGESYVKRGKYKTACALFKKAAAHNADAKVYMTAKQCKF